MVAVLLSILFLPLGGALGGLFWKRASAAIGVLSVSAAAILSLFVFFSFRLNLFSDLETSAPWFSLPGGVVFSIGLRLDAVASGLSALVTTVSAAVFVFSTAYMRYEENAPRYWATMGLFVSAMLGLIVSQNLLQLFFCWEIVGFCSYLLIGFWNRRPETGTAATLAFLTNRLGDVALLAGICLLGTEAGTLAFSELSGAALSSDTRTLIGGLLLCGALAKSAQFPFQLWLPEAMAGPTTASALIHAATMVAAGVYLAFRIYPIFTPEILTFCVFIGGWTALSGAMLAALQSDMKRVLAYSTGSQLGLMFLAIGAGAPESALFHLWTHAYFKCGLFLSAAYLLSALHEAGRTDAQTLFSLGGLRRVFPALYMVTALFSAALIGLPFTSGFLSKESIFYAAAQHSNSAAFFVWITSFATAYYVTRWFSLIFLGEKSRSGDLENLTYSGRKTMLGVLGALSLFATALPFAFPNFLSLNDVWLLSDAPSGLALLTATALLAPALGITSGYFAFKQNLYFRSYKIKDNRLYAKFIDFFIVKTTLSLASFLAWWDARILDGFINGAAKVVADAKIGTTPVSLAAGINWIEVHLFDGTIRALVKIIYGLGSLARNAQTGRLQTYLVFSLALFLTGLFWLMWVK